MDILTAMTLQSSNTYKNSIDLRVIKARKALQYFIFSLKGSLFYWISKTCHIFYLNRNRKVGTYCLIIKYDDINVCTYIAYNFL